MSHPPRLGLSENRGQFALLVLVNACVGAVVGAERSVLPLLAEEEFGLVAASLVLTFLVGFGLTKALANYLAGVLAHRVGRKRILLLGWAFGVPVPLILWWAPAWEWVVAANLLLGVNQGLAWSATVIMKIDLVGPRQRGLAMGLNEFAGYLAVALAAVGTGYLAGTWGTREGAVAIAAGGILAGLLVSALWVRDTGDHVALEHASASSGAGEGPPALPAAAAARFRYASWGHRPMLAANQAGLVNNLNDGLAWGLLPLFFAAEGLSLREVGWLAGLYPAVWSVTQVATGAWSDWIDRRRLIEGGMLLQALGLGLFAVGDGLLWWLPAAVVLGLGTAAVYPTLIAQVSDLVRPADRAGAVGIYRLWRDLGYVAGAVLAGVLADLLGFRVAIVAVALLTALSGVLAGRWLPARRG